MSGLLVASLLACGSVVAGQHETSGPPPAQVGRLVVGPPRDVATFGPKEAPGQPTHLAWSPDGAQVYIRKSTFDRWANETAFHLAISLATGQVTPLAAEPSWAAAYWKWKSSPVSPADTTFHVDFEARNELVRTTNVGREGNIGQNVADPAAGLDEVIQKAAQASQQARFETLTLRGRVIDRAVNQRLVPGRTFGWAPPPHALIAFVSEKQQLVLMDRAGSTRAVPGVRHVLLPAWSPDGEQIAFLEKGRGDRFTLGIVDVGF